MFFNLYAKEMADIDYLAIYNFLLPYLNKDDSILDAGMGPGYLLKILLDNNFNAIGVDNDTGMLSFATNELELYGKAFYHDLNEPINERYDVILSIFDVVNYFNDPKTLFTNIYNALNDGGSYIFDIYQEETLNKMNHFEEVHEDFTWKTKVVDNQMTHYINDAYEEVIINQYVYALNFYEELLKNIGFQTTVTTGPDKRKYYIIAKRV